MTRAWRSAVGRTALVVLGASLSVAGAGAGWAAWTDQVPVSGTTLSAHTVLPPASLSCSGAGLLSPLTYSWPSRDRRYTYRVQLVDSAGTIVKDQLVPESGLATYSVTYAVTDLPLGSFTVKVSSYLTGAVSWTSTGSTSRGGSKTLLTLGLTTSCG